MNLNYVDTSSDFCTTSFSGNVPLNTPQTYVHPWYLARRRLESTIQSAAESTQSPRLVKIGQKPTKLYIHPKCNKIGAAEDGTVYTLWSKGVGSRKPALTDEWREITTYCGAKFRPKQSIGIPSEVAKELNDKAQFRVVAGRFNLECYLGRSLEDWEVCRHGNAGNCDHSLKNLSVGCQLNNIIDEVESGGIKTTPEQIQIAINRLTAILSTTVWNY